MNIDAVGHEIEQTGGAHRTRFGRVKPSLNSLLSAFMTVLGGLLLVGVLASQAQAHDGHKGAASFSAPQIEETAFTESATLSGDVAVAVIFAATCDGHCCFAGTCCPNAAGPASGALPHPRTLDARSKREADADVMSSAAPEGPRRPPKLDI